MQLTKTALQFNLDNFMPFKAFNGSEKDYTNTTVNERAQDCILDAVKGKTVQESRNGREKRDPSCLWCQLMLIQNILHLGKAIIILIFKRN